MEVQSKSHPPLIPSQLSAKRSVEQWNYQRSRTVKDKDGLVWSLHINNQQSSSATDSTTITWNIRVQLKCQVDAETLIETKTLHEKDDLRMITLLNDRKIEFALKPITFSAGHEEEAFGLVNRNLSKYLKNIETTSLHTIKRALIGRFIDEQLKFATE